MPIDLIAALILLISIMCFTATNLYNILVVYKHRTNAEPYAEVEGPSGFAVNLAGILTLIYFLEAGTYILLALTSTFHLADTPLSFQFALTPYLQTLGLTLSTAGYALFIWSVATRGVYATSWKMSKIHKLVTDGPYRYVRHPSYLAYFLMFISLPIIWFNPFTFFPVVGILGYHLVAVREEELLTQRFGDEYTRYQKKTGRFRPKLRQKDKP